MIKKDKPIIFKKLNYFIIPLIFVENILLRNKPEFSAMFISFIFIFIPIVIVSSISLYTFDKLLSLYNMYDLFQKHKLSGFLGSQKKILHLKKLEPNNETVSMFYKYVRNFQIWWSISMIFGFITLTLI